MTDTAFHALNGGRPADDLDLRERVDGAEQEVVAESSSTLALFAGDEGVLDLGQRKARSRC